MKQYLDLLKDIRTNGVWKEPAREGMPRTQEINGAMMKFNLQDGFPLLTTKKMYTKSIILELLWFLRGDTNIKYLVDNGCNIWNQDAYKYYKRLGGTLDINDFIDRIKNDPGYAFHIEDDIEDKTYLYGDLGNIYGHQWRNWGGGEFSDITDLGFDQIENLIEGIRENPDSRYHIVTAWNPTDFLQESTNAALPACHMMFQCFVRDGYLDLIMYQRSCDTFLGVPFNIASYALLTHIIAALTGLKPGIFTWVGGSVHVYENHIAQVDEQLSRSTLTLPTLTIADRGQEEIEDFVFDDFMIWGYNSHPAIKGELSVGK